MQLLPSPEYHSEVWCESPTTAIHKLLETNYGVPVPGKSRDCGVYRSNLIKPYREREAVVYVYVNLRQTFCADISELRYTVVG